jgi:hypothetical protein
MVTSTAGATMSMTGKPPAVSSIVKPLRSSVTLTAAMVMTGPIPAPMMSRVTM